MGQVDNVILVPTSLIRFFGTLCIGLILLAAWFFGGLFSYSLTGSGNAQAAQNDPVPIASTISLPKPVAKWDKPDLAIILTGQQHGYLLPCGCSRPQVGGLERRFNFIQGLKSQGWKIAALDLGDLPHNQGLVSLSNEQGLIKYRYAMMAQKAMGYSAVGFGEYEASLPLFNALAEYALNDPLPKVLGANLKDREKEFPDQVGTWAKVETSGSQVKFGVTAVVGPGIAGKIQDPRVKFSSSKDALAQSLEEMNKAKLDLKILLYQGVLKGVAKGASPSEALAAVHAFPQFQVVLCLSEEEEPSSNPIVVTHPETKEQILIIRIGMKGKYIGVLGVYKNPTVGQPYKFRYTIAQMAEDYLTPASAKKNHPVIDLMERYGKELKADNYLSRNRQVRHPAQVAFAEASPVYVGSDKCKKCHESAFAVWKKSPHSHAYQTLVQAKEPSNRQFDPECIVCHTVGFGFQSGFTTLDKTPILTDVGCESCHGPASEHVKKATDERWYKVLNPWKPQPSETAKDKELRLGKIDQFCQKCHDIDNDVHWTNKGFERKWPLVAHPTPVD
ncbi:MAG: hypothetical protein EXR99_07160 [Gemmataceae bacterium]|nr:hypothetical protein [Gemmataceae bacterium]